MWLKNLRAAKLSGSDSESKVVVIWNWPVRRICFQEDTSLTCLLVGGLISSPLGLTYKLLSDLKSQKLASPEKVLKGARNKHYVFCNLVTPSLQPCCFH